jgi:hypothetical protein
MLTLIEQLQTLAFRLNNKLEVELKEAPEPHWAGPRFEERIQRIRLLTMQKKDVEQLTLLVERLYRLEGDKINLGLKQVIQEAIGGAE